MSLVSSLIEQAIHRTALRPWPGLAVDADTWRAATLGLGAGEVSLVALWAGDAGTVHMALRDPADGQSVVLSLATTDGTFPSVGLTHPPALRPERVIRELHGLVPEGCPDDRDWLDQGRWGVRHPLGAATAVAADGDAYAFRAAEGVPMHQIAVGPVHAGIIEPGHFRFTANGEHVVRLEERLGYVHKGVDSLLRGASIVDGARLAARVSGDSTVAYSIAYARAVEAALGLAIPERAVWLRALMAELERIANHLGDIGAICNDAAFAMMLAHCGVLREQVLRAAKATFGHRLMMDRVIPGGVAVDLTDAAPIRKLVAAIRSAFPALISLYDNSASLQNRTVSTGTLDAGLARQYAVGGPVGRASGLTFDARKAPGYAPYPDLVFNIPVRESGDVDGRVWIRIDEVNESLGLIDQILTRLPSGPIAVALPTASEPSEGVALAEAFRGDVMAWVKLGADGRLAAAHLRDASVFQWPLLEAVIENNIVADFPLCNKSFNCSYSGHDL
ncbi:hydrogenase large subunit [Oryzibacter oryziterrae]|uniref:hydrogenase large subunit n=1 Tax=Oryzibacter oryziterrae TaxID=2766474 RepID=UPI001F2AF043|nr:NADH-quinone oxidoreductase subunit C [Oryzibacter oryziterrae]